MSKISPPDLVKVTELFLIPNSFIVAALGTADSNPHRAAVSLLGLIISALWWICSHEVLAESIEADDASAPTSHSRRIRILAGLPIVFTLGWIASAVVHVLIWNRPLGQ